MPEPRPPEVTFTTEVQVATDALCYMPVAGSVNALIVRLIDLADRESTKIAFNQLVHMANSQNMELSILANYGEEAMSTPRWFVIRRDTRILLVECAPVDGPPLQPVPLNSLVGTILGRAWSQ
jgi:hypothetical protein